MKIIGISGCLMFMIGLYIFILIKGGEKIVTDCLKTPKKNNFFTIDVEFSVYLKIFLNYLQMLSSFSQLDLQLPSFIHDYLSFSSIFGSAPTQFMSLDCLSERIIFLLILFYHFLDWYFYFA